MKKRLVIINSNIELIIGLREIFEEEGYRVSSYQVLDLKTGRITLKDVLADQPDYVIYDVAIPYVENWDFFTKIKDDLGRKAKIVLTTTNKEALEKFVGKTDTIEIIGKPFNVDDILAAVR